MRLMIGDSGGVGCCGGWSWWPHVGRADSA